MSAVPDASFLARAIIHSQLLPEAESTLDQLLVDRALMRAPFVLQAEFGSLVRGLEARRRIDSADALTAWTRFRSLPVDYRWRDEWVDRALEIARAAGHSKVYDAIYLACAESYGFELLTADGRLARSAGPFTTAPIRLLEPAP